MEGAINGYLGGICHGFNKFDPASASLRRALLES